MMMRLLPVVFSLLLGVSAWAQDKTDSPAEGGAASPTLRGDSPILVDYNGGDPEQITGDLSQTDSTYNRLLGGCGAPSGVGTDVFFDEVILTNNAAGDLEVVVSTSGPDGTTCAGTGDTFLSAYAPTFDPAQPTMNCVASDDDGGDGLCSLVTVTVPQGEAMSFVVTSFGNGATFDWWLNFQCVGDCPEPGGGGEIPESAPVPAMGMLGLLILVLVVAGIGYLVLRRN